MLYSGFKNYHILCSTQKVVSQKELKFPKIKVETEDVRDMLDWISSMTLKLHRMELTHRHNGTTGGFY